MGLKSSRSLPLRLQAMGLVSNITMEPDYGTILKIGSKLEAYIDEVPVGMRFNNALSAIAGRLVGQMVVENYLRKPLACLYRTFALGAAEDEVFLEGRRACIRNALTILAQQDVFDPEVADLRIVNSNIYWDWYYVISRTEFMQAALTVCLEIKSLSEVSSNEDIGTIQDPHGHTLWRNWPTFNWTKASLTRTVENALNCLLRRLDKPGTDLRDPLALSMALQSARIAGSQETTDNLMKVGAERVLKACRQVCNGIGRPSSDIEKQYGMVWKSVFTITLKYISKHIEHAAYPYGDTAYKLRRR
jgi:hypothetical protein